MEATITFPPSQFCPRRRRRRRSLGVATLVRAEHDVVGRRVAERCWVAHLRTDLHVSATALHVLFVLGLILKDQLLAHVAEGVEGRGNSEKSRILARLHARVLRPC